MTKCGASSRNDNGTSLMSTLQSILKKYSYTVPPELIAQQPASPRDSARLLVYDRKYGTVRFGRFQNVTRYLPKGAVLVFNQTKVIPARLTVTKESSGRVRILFVRQTGKEIEILSDRALRTGMKLYVSRGTFFTVVRRMNNVWRIKPPFLGSRLRTLFEKYGEAPIPPYIKRSPLTRSQLKKEYQTVFARIPGSIAAPTASLHFTPRLIKSIKKAGHDIHFVTLHVNLGTFAPLTDSQLKSSKLHKEWYEIPRSTMKALNRARKQGRPIVAVGTTVVRTLESAFRRGRLQQLSGLTDLFIRQGYAFRFVDGMITNFHVPQSSLMMLVAALVGRQTLHKLYRMAIRKRFRFFSFGDGMLII